MQDENSSFDRMWQVNLALLQVNHKFAEVALSTSGCVSRWLAVAFTCALFPTIAASHAGQCQVSAISALMISLENWLDREGRYPRRTDPATVRLITTSEAMPSRALVNYSNSMRRGYYDPQSSTIYLVEPWSQDNPHDVSVLLHELVHHRQQMARNWECPNAQELPAYRLQDKWLAERGLKARVNWLAVLIESSCSPRDIHPD
jgi:Domain of unknown function (DUF6647)